MELYLDSANLKEIEEGFKLGFCDESCGFAVESVRLILFQSIPLLL